VRTWNGPISIFEISGPEFEVSRSSTQRKRYRVMGVPDEISAGMIVSGASAAYLNGLVRQSIRGTEESAFIWKVDVTYGDEDDDKSRGVPEPGMWEYTFATGEAQHTITQSKKTLWKGEMSPSEPAPDMQGAINVDDKGVNGISIPVPDPKFSITAYFDPRVVTTEFFFKLNDLAFQTNSAPWLGAQFRDLLFLGVEGRGDLPTMAGQRTKPVPVTMSFAHQPTRRNFKVGSITVPIKRGWEVLHTRYGTFGDEKATLRRVVHAWVEQVFDEFDFHQLGITERNRRR
jgi:hypothetical protein